MLQFWSVWNFNWWLLSQLKIIKLDYSLATSIIGTSIIGGFLIHVYPGRLKVTYKNNRILIPYKYAIWIDLLGHQLPLYMLYKQRNQIVKTCGKYITIPITIYSITNYLNNTPMSKTYGVPSSYLYLTGGGIISTLGTIYHCNKIPNYSNGKH